MKTLNNKFRKFVPIMFLIPIAIISFANYPDDNITNEKYVQVVQEPNYTTEYYNRTCYHYDEPKRRLCIWE